MSYNPKVLLGYISLIEADLPMFFPFTPPPLSYILLLLKRILYCISDDNFPYGASCGSLS